MHRRQQGWWQGAMIAFLLGMGLAANAASSKVVNGPGIKSAAALVVDANNG